jgi:hypothetical protein
MRYVVQLLSLLYLCLFRMPWIRVLRHYDRRSRNILWIYPCAPARPLEYLGRSVIVGDLAYVDALARRGIGFRLVAGRRIGRVHGSRILYNPSHQFMNPFALLDYPTFLLGTARALERQGNRLLPGSDELAFWENKGFMYQRFASLGIAHPETHLLKTEDLPHFAALPHPYLVKELHSAGGRGLHKVDAPDEQARLARRLIERGQYEIVAQRLVPMTRDLRVTVIGDDVVLAYWRINPGPEWRPTGTSGGSRAVFGDFPDEWRGYFVETTRKLGLTAAAYDVAWESDDVRTQPLILEVSSFFQPNPPPPAAAQHLAYRDYKKRLFGRSPFFKARVDAYCRIARLRIAAFASTVRFD